MLLGLSSERMFINRLLMASLAPRTITSYCRSYDDFVVWLYDNGWLVRSSYSIIDKRLAMYLLDLDDHGAGRGVGTTTLSALVALYPELRDRVPVSRRTLKGYLALRPSRQYPPLSWGLTVVIAMWMSYHYGCRYGIATLLCFDGYLRVNEMVNIQVDDIAFPHDDRLLNNDRCEIRLRSTKTGVNQSTVIRNGDVVRLLAIIVRARRHDRANYLWSFTYSQYYRAFKSALIGLGLSSEYVCHSLRHGAASRDAAMNVAVEEIAVRGRWRSLDSLRRYLQTYRALMLSMKVPPRVADMARMCGNHPYDAIEVVTELRLAKSHD